MKNKLRELYKKRNEPYNISNPLLYFFIFFVDYALYIRYLLKNLKNHKYMKATRLLQNTMKDQNAFVFANGPSLNKLDLKKVKAYQQNLGYKIICVNSFLGKFSSQIIPDYYVISDPVYFGYNEDLLKEGRLEELKADLQLIEQYNITVFIPLAFQDRVNLKTNVYYFNDFELKWFNNNVTDITKPRAYLSMTAYKALAISTFLGFKNIYISGFDNNWFKSIEVDKENNMYYKNEHAINQACSGKHMVPKKESENIGSLLNSHSTLFLDLYKFPKNIINLDGESLLDAFTKESELDLNMNYKN